MTLKEVYPKMVEWCYKQRDNVCFMPIAKFQQETNEPIHILETERQYVDRLNQILQTYPNIPITQSGEITYTFTRLTYLDGKIYWYLYKDIGLLFFPVKQVKV